MADALRAGNLALRFVLELCALTAVAFSGYRLAGPHGFRWAVAVVLPLAVAVSWGVFVAPRSAIGIPAETRMWIGTAILLACGAALGAARKPGLALVFAAVVMANAVVMQVANR